jgi:hypothetical protein
MSEFVVDKYTVLKLEDRGQYGFSIMEGWVNRDGNFKPSFCKREVGKAGEKVEKTMPVNVKVGDRAAVAKLAYWLIGEVGAKMPESTIPAVGEEDTPF